ncbi:MAG: sugar phosphate isomerase/epimerase [Clostridia bacterium]|nr:sugar phosphate isomerase/epimerase [Clostridia bacterium]
MNFTLGMTSVTFREKTIEEVVSLAKKASLSEIEWGGDRHIPPADAEAIYRAREAMEKEGLLCSSYGSYYRFGDNDADTFRAICKTSQDLGAGIVRTWLGRRGSAVMPPEMRADILEETKNLADIAAEYGQILAFEFHGKTLNDNGESSIAFLCECQKENVKTYWQPLSFSDNAKNLSLVLPYLTAVHVFTWDDAYQRYPLSDGEAQWKQYLSILKNADISTKLIMEFVKNDSEEQFLADAAFLHEISKY